MFTQEHATDDGHIRGKLEMRWQKLWFVWLHERNNELKEQQRYTCMLTTAQEGMFYIVHVRLDEELASGH